MPRTATVTTETESMILEYIVAFKTDNDGNSPTIRQICDYLGSNSTSEINRHLNRMAEKGLIKRNTKCGQSRMIAVVGGTWSAPAVKPN